MGPNITPGRVENKKAQLMQERAETNAERKLREMLIPKKHRIAYKKMVHSVKRKEKEVRQLAEKRREIDSWVDFTFYVTVYCHIQQHPCIRFLSSVQFFNLSCYSLHFIIFGALFLFREMRQKTVKTTVQG